MRNQKINSPARLCIWPFLLLLGLLSGCQSQPAAPTMEIAVLPDDGTLTTAPEPTSEPILTDVPISTMPPTKIPLPSQIVDDFSVPMVLIAVGSFEMGSENSDPNESPVHTVDLAAFYMDVYEVTNVRYLECVEAGICSEHNATEINDPMLANFPMRNVSWYEANTYCKWRGAQLPTEAQWEKAARGGSVGKLYPWGDDDPICEFGAVNGAKFDDEADCHDTGPEPVGSYAPNGYGLYDMAGNVVEWTLDWLADDYYSHSPWENPLGPDSGKYKVVRGGSWHTGTDTLLIAHRYGVLPRFAYNLLGFRCVVSISE
ncbi:MAG: formylglycine-generating enzyme family protein [Chloroflexota bacterium]|nr:formylglycine-generating enzyme family protein [Chloroflexota bacterium]